MPGHSGESECRDGVKSAAKVRCALLQPIQHRHWCICLASPRSVTPSRPPLAPSLIALLSLLEAGQAVAVCAWPRANAFPDSPAHVDVQALSQLRLHKSFRVVKELSTPEIAQVFNKHLTAVDFPHLRHA